jgi:hypothetical protein
MTLLHQKTNPLEKSYRQGAGTLWEEGKRSLPVVEKMRRELVAC